MGQTGGAFYIRFNENPSVLEPIIHIRNLPNIYAKCGHIFGRIEEFMGTFRVTQEVI